jgi:hypothetical protein
MMEFYKSTESNMFQFFMIPKDLMKDNFKKLSFGAKFLYGLLLDRNSLSIKNNWVDENNNIYIYYSRENVMSELNISRPKATALFKELNEFSLIKEGKQGLGKPNRIYVMKFIKPIRVENTQKEKIFPSGQKKSFSLEGKNLSPNYTELNKTEISKTDNTNKDRQMSTKEEIITNGKTKSIENKEIAEIKSDIERVVNGTINIKSLKKVLNESDIKIDDIKYYLDNWNKFKYKSKDNPIGFFLDCVKNKVPVPKREQGFNKPDQSYNFDQREYDDTDFEDFDNGKYNS